MSTAYNIGIKDAGLPTYAIWDIIDKKKLTDDQRFILYKMIELAFKTRLVHSDDIKSFVTMPEVKVSVCLDKLTILGHLTRLKDAGTCFLYEVNAFAEKVPFYLKE